MAKTKNFLVVQRFYDNGRTEAEILNFETDREKIAKFGYMDGQCIEGTKCDVYVDAFASRKEADHWAEETLNA